MADGRVVNFSPGPGQMPLEVLLEVQAQMVNYKGTGMSVMEMSHRSKEFTAIAEEAERNLRDVASVPGDYKVMFMQGGASLQFSAIPLNMLGAKTKADYAVTGRWSEKAVGEFRKYGAPNEACNTGSTKFTTIPDVRLWKMDPEAAYVHYCANETIDGVEFGGAPDVGSTPLVADMSSNFLSRDIDVSKHAYIYAGAHKNIGPAGVCVGILHPKFADGSSELKICPTYCSWKEMARHGSMYNTPATFSWYVVGEYLKYTKRVGGVAHWSELSDKKARLIYDVIDGSDGFYGSMVEKTSRSRMNIPFTVCGGNDAMERKFLAEATALKLYGLAGHKVVGHCRASMYNGMPVEGVEKLAEFMKSFQDENRD
jgi:phosphoserine aminotransferase